MRFPSPFPSRPCRRAAFTLIEMSIVLLVIGLIVGGIVATRELFRLSQLSSVTAEMTQFGSAINAFKIKYRALPGDMADATRYFGALASCPNGTATDSKTCNGNGNGRIGDSGAEYESLRAWQHLAAADLVAAPKSGYYSGVPGPQGTAVSPFGQHVYGVNALASRMPKAGYALFYVDRVTDPAHPVYFPGEYGNTLTVGARIGTAPSLRADSSYLPDNFAFTATDAQGIDTKFDDAKPGLGRIRARIGAASSGMPECVSGLGGDAATAAYRVDLALPACYLHLLHAAD